MKKRLKEIWKYVEGSDEVYVSNFGKVYRHGKPARMTRDPEGYLRCSLGGEIKKSVRAHQLIGDAFLPKRQGKPFIHFKDWNKNNLHISNLERVSERENALLMGKTGRHSYHSCYKIRMTHSSGKSIIFDSQAEAARILNIPVSGINKCLKGKRGFTHGFKCEYIYDVA